MGGRVGCREGVGRVGCREGVGRICTCSPSTLCLHPRLSHSWVEGEGSVEERVEGRMEGVWSI